MINFRADDDDDDDFMSSNFEMELANMDQGDEQKLLGEGPENQQTNIKWVSSYEEKTNIDSFQLVFDQN